MFPTMNPTASAAPLGDTVWPGDESTSGAVRWMRLGHWCKKPEILDPSIPLVPESESDPAEDSDNVHQSSTSIMSMKILYQSASWL
jgi:hypothetical protein